MAATETGNAFVAAWSDHDLHAAIVMATEDCVVEATGPRSGGARLAGRDAVRAARRPIVDDASARFEVEEALGACDRVGQRWLYSWDGGHLRGVDLFTVRDGKVTQKLSYVEGCPVPTDSPGQPPASRKREARGPAASPGCRDLQFAQTHSRVDVDPPPHHLLLNDPRGSPA
jgi:ketosteroid isomerase-like protein